MPHSSLAIANEFLRRARESEPRRSLTHMQLQKLVYLAHGWNLAVNGDPLISDSIEAWNFGPVIRRLFDALRSYGRNPVTEYIKWGDDTPFPSDDDGPAFEELTGAEQAVIDEVWKNYGELQAFQLSALTHEQNSPWQKVYKQTKNNPIENGMIQRYFENLANAAAE